jgi:hypothetical protein
VVEHLPDGDRRAEIWQLGDVGADRIVERQLAVPRQQQHCGRGELLRNRAGLEDGVRSDRYVVLEIRHPIGGARRDVAVRHP